MTSRWRELAHPGRTFLWEPLHPSYTSPAPTLREYIIQQQLGLGITKKARVLHLRMPVGNSVCDLSIWRGSHSPQLRLVPGSLLN